MNPSNAFQPKIETPSKKENLKELSDGELIKRIQEKDDQAFTVFVERYQRQIESFIASMMPKHTGIVADIRQETFINALEAFRKNNFTDLENAKAWLYTIARNATINHFRKNKKDALNRTKEMLGTGKGEGEENVIFRFIKEEGISQEDLMIAEELETEINSLLTEREKLYLQMLYEDTGEDTPDGKAKQKRTYEDAASELDIPLGTFKSRVFYARKKIEYFLKHGKRMQKPERQSPEIIDPLATERALLKNTIDPTERAKILLRMKEYAQAVKILKTLPVPKQKEVFDKLSLTERGFLVEEWQK